MRDVPILVISCDAYSDVWRPFFEVFFARWSDCPFPVCLGANHRAYDDDRVRTLAIGDDVSWGDNVLKMIDGLGGVEWLIMFLEDFLLTRPVSTEEVTGYVELAQQEELGCLRLAPRDYPARPIEGRANLGVLGRRVDYRVSTQVAIWRVDTLRALLQPGYTPWDFEWIGSLESGRRPEPFWSVMTPVVDYIQCVQRGKWRPEGFRICGELGVEIDTDARPAMDDREIAEFEQLLARRRWKSRIPGPVRYLIRRAKYRKAGRR